MTGEHYIVREEEQIKADLSSYLKQHEEKEMLRFLVAGSVDDGKSTLIGRLLYDSRLIYRDHLNAIYRESQTYNTTGKEIDLSLLTDGLRAEREQGITIDVAYRYFSTEKRSFIICDAPGHEQYTRNMATGASHCNLALILVDAEKGIRAQTRRHSLIATLMGIRQVVVVVNKMDLRGYREEAFREICEVYKSFSRQLSIDMLHFIPVSALEGDNVVESSSRMSWYKGNPLLALLEEVPPIYTRNLSDFRFPVQYVIRPDASFRGYAGSIASGVVRKGDEVVVLPSRRKTRIRSIETFDGPLPEAFAPMPVVLTTEDEVDISRGEMIAKAGNMPQAGNRLEAMVVWMDDNRPLCPGSTYLLKSNTQTVPCRVESLRYRYDVDELTHVPAEKLGFNDIGAVTVVTGRPLFYDPFPRNRITGSFILIDRMSNQTSGGGIILDRTTEGGKKPDIRLVGPQPVALWLTGLSGSGKTTLAEALKEQLEKENIPAYILDGDRLRRGLNSNLGFSPEDRKENVRRVAEVAGILNDAGLVCIVALISPYGEDRKMAKEIIGFPFREVWVKADLDTCRRRDPKGLYKKADAGEIRNFTGIDAPYEIPLSPDLVLDTTALSIDKCVEKLCSLCIL